MRRAWRTRASSLDVFSTAAEALASLPAGRIGAAVVRQDEALRATGHDPDLQVGAGIGPRQSLAFAMRKGDTALSQTMAPAKRHQASDAGTMTALVGSESIWDLID